ncbi:MAG TPA: flavodoxin-dependent (E)-4-hydroxy-3-methylbut-2-enyl-diphosphate synthase [Chitinispirillaceae bacterium]|nr:flavodoxin-dependent (E)-4-hydroxy-3-methylbut-2-enyl-diphosphate synthase [Chitinispirillaceae bacterium]
MFERKVTNQISVRDIRIGGSSSVVIQSMTNTASNDVDGTLEQIEQLTAVGCKIVRIAVPDEKSVESFKEIRRQTNVPLVADIHFNYKLAIASIEAGADKIRINPGNIGSDQRVKMVVDAARNAKIPIRIGINSGSLEKKLLLKYGGPTPEALLECAQNYISMMDSWNFHNIILSIKASDVLTTIRACRLLASHTNVPQHIGITESGTVRSGSIRSSVGIGTLLAEGIGDTIRVSLAGNPVEEIYVAKEILKSLELLRGPVVIACPTCGRTQIDVALLANQVEQIAAGIETPVKIAVMGCVVNGPGEARDADIGIAGGKHEGLLFVKGEPVCKVPEDELLSKFREILDKQILKGVS